MAAVQGPTPRCGRIVKVDKQRAREPLGLQTLADIFGQRPERCLGAAGQWFERGTEPAQRSIGETPDVVARTDRGARLLPLR